MLFPLLMVNPLRQKFLNSNHVFNRSFSFYGNNFNPFEKENEYDDKIVSLYNQNNFLCDYGTNRRNQMQEEKQCLNSIYSCRNKYNQLMNLKKETIKKLLNLTEQYINEEKAEKEKCIMELKNIIEAKNNNKLKKKNHLNYLQSKLENKKKLELKEEEQRLLNKRNKQNKIINEKRNEEKIKLMKYEKNKIIQNEKKKKKFLLDKNQLKIDTNLKLNDLKNKSEMVPKLIYFFENTK